MDIVTLDVALKEDHLEVDDAANKNHIGRGHKTEIHWRLIPEDLDGSFNAKDFFELLEPHPEPDPFGEPTLHHHGKHIHIIDDNTNAPGTWTYRLRATIDGKHYSTLNTLGVAAGAANPNIKNN